MDQNSHVLPARAVARSDRREHGGDGAQARSLAGLARIGGRNQYTNGANTDSLAPLGASRAGRWRVGASAGIATVQTTTTATRPAGATAARVYHCRVRPS